MYIVLHTNTTSKTKTKALYHCGVQRKDPRRVNALPANAAFRSALVLMLRRASTSNAQRLNSLGVLDSNISVRCEWKRNMSSLKRRLETRGMNPSEALEQFLLRVRKELAEESAQPHLLRPRGVVPDVRKGRVRDVEARCLERMRALCQN